MASIRTLVFPMFLLLLAPLAAAGPRAGDAGVAEARAAIDAANARFSEAFARADAKALADLYTPDAIVFPPDSEMVRGNEAIGEFWKATRSSVKSATLTTLDVGRSGDLAYETGTAALVVQAEGPAPSTAAVKYVVVWKREAKGVWKLHRDIWNSLPPPK